MPDTIVVDTNVFISALRSAEGHSRVVLRLCLQRRATPVMSAALLAEHEDVMAREALFESCPLNAAEREALLNAFLSVCQWTRIYYLWRPNLRDEADNHLIELAVAGHANYLITHNIRDFNHAELRFPALSIVTPNRFLELKHENFND